MCTKLNYAGSLLIVTALLPGCATTPVEVVCPRLPNPPQMLEVPPPFLPQMELFLSNSRVKPTDSAPATKPASPTSSR